MTGLRPVRRIPDNGNDVSVTGEQEDPQYAGLKGVWKDTLYIKQPLPSPAHYIAIVRARYQRYIGDFVLHCHILDHEDQGMIQIIRIAIPDGMGGVTSGRH